MVIFTVTAFHPAEASVQDSAEPEGMDPRVFFIISMLGCGVIGILAAMSGVGGGVVFTPLFMGFTSIDSYVIRTTGLFIAMAGSLVASKHFLKNGVANIRIILIGALPYAFFAVLGAILAGYLKTTLGDSGEALLRGALGILVVGIACIFIFFGKKTEYPEVSRVDKFTQRLHLSSPYWERSLDNVVDYKVTRSGQGLLLFCFVGLISGLFGMGAGGAMIPVFNMVMMAPLKVAATCSTVMISIGSTAAVWPYIRGGGMLPLFAVPCMIGLMVGAAIGARIMVKIKAGFIRWIIIFVMIGSGIRLISKAISMI